MDMQVNRAGRVAAVDIGSNGFRLAIEPLEAANPSRSGPLRLSLPA